MLMCSALGMPQNNSNLKWLQDASAELKQAHIALVDTTEGDEDLATEQATLDELLDTVENLATRLQTLIDYANKPKPVDKRKVIAKRLGHLQKCLTTIDEAIKAWEGYKLKLMLVAWKNTMSSCRTIKGS